MRVSSPRHGGAKIGDALFALPVHAGALVGISRDHAVARLVEPFFAA